MALRIAYGRVRFSTDTAMTVMLLETMRAYSERGFDCWITSANDSKHSDASLHYKGLAIDFRRHHVPDDVMQEIADEVAKHLSPLYDVVLEKTHLHIEYDPE